MKNWNHVNDPVKITETRLCEVLLLTLKHKSVLQLATEGLTTEPLKKGDMDRAYMDALNLQVLLSYILLNS